jgi:hypothetical protein
MKVFKHNGDNKEENEEEEGTMDTIFIKEEK